MSYVSTDPRLTRLGIKYGVTLVYALAEDNTDFLIYEKDRSSPVLVRGSYFARVLADTEEVLRHRAAAKANPDGDALMRLAKGKH